MAIVDKGDLRLGFWLGIGLLAAFLVWGLAAGLVGRARGAA